MQNKSGDIIITKLHSNKLKRLAKAGGGIYTPFTNDDSDINTLLKSIDSSTLERQAQDSHQRTTLWKDEGFLFALFILPLAAFIFRRGWFSEILK